MCYPVTQDHDYEVQLQGERTCEMGHKHPSSKVFYGDSFADVFKGIRDFWTENAGSKVTVTLKIAPGATSHLSAKP